MEEDSLKFLIVGENPFWCRGIRAALDAQRGFFTFGAAANPAVARHLYATHSPHFVVFDWESPSFCPPALVRELAEIDSAGKVIAISNREEIGLIHEAFRVGARAFLSTRDPECELLNAVSHLVLGESRYVGNRARRCLLGSLGRSVPRDAEIRIDRLSDREREVFFLIAEGSTLAETATRLGVSAKTIETHYHRIKLKLNLPSNAALRAEALHHRQEER